MGHQSSLLCLHGSILLCIEPCRRRRCVWAMSVTPLAACAVVAVTQSAFGPVDHLIAALVAPCRYTRLSARQADLDEVLKVDSTIWQRLCQDRLFQDFDSNLWQRLCHDRLFQDFDSNLWHRLCPDRLFQDFDST